MLCTWFLGNISALALSEVQATRAPRLQWHRLQWHSGYSDSFLVQKKISLLYWKSRLQWHSGYSDTFWPPQHCHCKRGGLYWKPRAMPNEWYIKGYVKGEICISKPGNDALNEWYLTGKICAEPFFPTEVLSIKGSMPEFLALKHKSRILGHSPNPVFGFSMMEQVRLCAVWSMEN